ncbi:MAG: hypothetical protein EPGJADBJ_04485 [Saprospiraceae bacterium]|nr:hypothetical protein [Saprospiraceae bacterium]
MNTTTVIPGESLADVSVRAYGRLDALPALAAANGLAMTASVAAGQELWLPVVVFPKPVESRTTTAQLIERTAVVKAGQTLPDIAVQYCGNMSAFPAIAALNGLNLTDEIVAGATLKLPPVVDKRAAYILSGGYFPAAGRTLTQIGGLEGVDYWGIEFDFIVQ